jgi:hypothetical protein
MHNRGVSHFEPAAWAMTNRSATKRGRDRRYVAETPRQYRVVCPNLNRHIFSVGKPRRSRNRQALAIFSDCYVL